MALTEKRIEGVQRVTGKGLGQHKGSPMKKDRLPRQTGDVGLEKARRYTWRQIAGVLL